MLIPTGTRVFRGLRAVVFLGALALIPGCATSRQTPLSRADPVRLNVPFFAQDTDQCGPSSLASVLSFWGMTGDPETLRKEIYREKLKGSLPMDLMFAAQDHGLTAEIKNSTIEALREELKAGRPAIAYLNLGYTFMPVGHFVVVTGFDHHGLLAHSAAEKDKFYAYKDFEKKWSKTENWLLVAEPSKEKAKNAG